ncbi:MAG: dihydrofolate reductase [Bacilli bacterium]|nr:dihydrofolate reductase [Bacilli bacterium]MDY6392561.1 dihydrofolate reductase [Bacilli bacterium]
MSKVISILNCDCRYGIGKRNGLLFRLPADMAFFKASTMGHVVAMGENTLLSFPKQKPLPNRTNIVLSQDPTHNYENVINVHSFDEFLGKILEFCKENDVFIIGGASIYRQMIPYVDEVWLNKVDADGEAEVFFENLDEREDYELIEQREPVLDNGYTTRICIYRNKSPKR